MATTIGHTIDSQIRAMGHRTLWISIITVALIAGVIALAVSLYRGRSDFGPFLTTPASDARGTHHGIGTINQNGEGDNMDARPPNEIRRSKDPAQSPTALPKLPGEVPAP